MSTAPAVQIHPDSLDIHGITSATTTRSFADPRLGTVYNPTTLAAAAPIYFHPTPTPNNFIAVFSRRYINATPATNDPAAYTAWTLDAAPSWAVMNSITGTTTPIHGSFSIPMATDHDTAVVQGGCSVPPGYLYLLNTVTSGGVTSAVVQHFFWNNFSVMNTLAEETVPTITVEGQHVVFDRGIYFDSPFVVVIGYGLINSRIYLCRQQFGGFGNPSYSWQYQTANGWSSDPTEATSLLMRGGDTHLHTFGPASAVIYKSRVFLSTVQTTVDTGNVGTVFVPTTKNQWKQYGTPVSLGTVGSTYLGGMYLQQQLGAHPAASVVANQKNVAAYPYVTNQLVVGGGNSKVNTAWDLLGIPRLV